MALGGWSISSPVEAARFGVPGFIPFPLNTILGFCLSVALLTVASKVVVTTGIVNLMMSRHEKAA